MIYLINAKNTNMYKIGYTSMDAENRITNLKTGCPYELSIIKEVDGSEDTEKLLHKTFKKYRKNGEWFEFNKKILKKVTDQLSEKNINIKKDLKSKPKTKNYCFKGDLKTMQFLERISKYDDRNPSYMLRKMIYYFMTMSDEKTIKILLNREI